MSTVHFSRWGATPYVAPVSFAIPYPLGCTIREFQDFSLELGLFPPCPEGELERVRNIDAARSAVVASVREDIDSFECWLRVSSHRSALVACFGVQLNLFD